MARIKITGSGLHGEISVNGAKVPEVMSADLGMRAGSLTTLSLEIAAFPVEVEVEGEIKVTGTAQPEHIERALLQYLSDKYAEAEAGRRVQVHYLGDGFPRTLIASPGPA